MAWIYFPESAESRLPLASGSDQSHTARSTATHKAYSSPECLKGFYQPPLFAMTFEHSMDDRLEVWLTSFTAASPARISLLRDLEKVWKRSGRAFSSRSCGWPKKSDQNSFSLKTSRRSVSEAWRLLGMNWPQQGLIVAGRLYPLLKLERHTSESGGSFWLTPTTATEDNYETYRVRMAGKADPKSRGKTKPTNLAMQVAMLPTPTASEGGRNKSASCSGAKIRPSLGMMASKNLWPMPTTQDASNNGGPSQHSRNSKPLNALVGGALNPQWVEWLMGYQIGWTELNASGTEWFRSRSKQRLKN